MLNCHDTSVAISPLTLAALNFCSCFATFFLTKQQYMDYDEYHGPPVAGGPLTPQPPGGLPQPPPALPVAGGQPPPLEMEGSTTNPPKGPPQPTAVPVARGPPPLVAGDGGPPPPHPGGPLSPPALPVAGGLPPVGGDGGPPPPPPLDPPPPPPPPTLLRAGGPPPPVDGGLQVLKGTVASSWRSPSYPRTASAATVKAAHNGSAEGCEQTSICQSTKESLQGPQAEVLSGLNQEL
uniref:Uncharacterized protein n=1 Tax=Amphimedon queenslandica TaxID=400682 RepID=A0A1X7V8P2_AMPQE